jgi:hypothetical protein
MRKGALASKDRQPNEGLTRGRATEHATNKQSERLFAVWTLLLMLQLDRQNRMWTPERRVGAAPYTRQTLAVDNIWTPRGAFRLRRALEYKRSLLHT